MLHALRQRGDCDLKALLTTTTGEDDQGRVTMHGVALATLRAQAAAAGLPVFEVHLPEPCPNEAYEEAMRGAIARARANGITHMAFGDLFLEDVRRYREEKLAGTGIEPMFPLWGRDTAKLSREMVAGGLRTRVVCVDTAALDESLAGREYDSAFLDDLPADCDPCGEHGEFHTFAYGGPMFDRELPLVTGPTRRVDRFVHVEPRLAG